jgi:hypothetical protein
VDWLALKQKRDATKDIWTLVEALGLSVCGLNVGLVDPKTVRDNQKKLTLSL